MYIPKRYIPNILTNKDKKKQRQNILKSRKLYTECKYYTRPKVSSYQ